MSLAGQGVVITGAVGGIGRGLAERMLAEGARVVVNDLDADATHETAAAIGAIAAPGDAATEAGVAALVATARDTLGEIDVWFGNAGISSGFGLDATEAEWFRCQEVNVMAHVRAARLLVPRWLERGAGRFVVTASAAGLLTMIGSPTYSVTKHGAVAFAEWLSATYRHRGIVVQAICPQAVRTTMFEESGPLREIAGVDAVLTPQQVADHVVEAFDDDRFLILPHTEVAGYYRARAEDPDRWLRGMNRIQQALDERIGS